MLGRALGGVEGVRALGRWEGVGRAGSSIFEIPRARGRPRGRGRTEED